MDIPSSKLKGMSCLTALLRSDSTELVEVKSPTRHTRFADGALRGMRSLLRFTLDKLETVTKALIANLSGSKDICR